jgi:hypothetical protein
MELRRCVVAEQISGQSYRKPPLTPDHHLTIGSRPPARRKKRLSGPWCQAVVPERGRPNTGRSDGSPTPRRIAGRPDRRTSKARSSRNPWPTVPPRWPATRRRSRRDTTRLSSVPRPLGVSAPRPPDARALPIRLRRRFGRSQGVQTSITARRHGVDSQLSHVVPTIFVTAAKDLRSAARSRGGATLPTAGPFLPIHSRYDAIQYLQYRGLLVNARKRYGHRVYERGGLV